MVVRTTDMETKITGVLDVTTVMKIETVDLVVGTKAAIEDMMIEMQASADESRGMGVVMDMEAGTMASRAMAIAVRLMIFATPAMREDMAVKVIMGAVAETKIIIHATDILKMM